MPNISFRLLAVAAVLACMLPFSASAAVPTGTLVKSAETSSVYYVAAGKRYAFPNEKIFFSWYPDFSTVVTISPEELASYPLSGNVTYKPGVRLVKITTDPKVYAVSRYGFLHWVTSEALARTFYGETWNMSVDDVPDTFFTNYQVKEPILTAADYDRTMESAIGSIILNLGIVVPLERAE